MVQQWTISQLFKNFQGRRKILMDNKMFLKDQGHNQLWWEIQEKTMALKDVRQP